MKMTAHLDTFEAEAAHRPMLAEFLARAEVPESQLLSTVCAWCGVITFDAGRRARRSYGICGSCAATLFSPEAMANG